MLKVAVWNFKGGTGKSITTQNLGDRLANLKYKTALIDLDGQRTLSFGLGMDGKTPTALDWLNGEEVNPIDTGIKNLSLIPGDIGMFRLSTDKNLMGKSLNGLIPLDLDICMMDCAPSLGIPSVQAILNADRVLLPTLCEPASLKGLSEAIALIRDEDADKPIDVLRVRYRSRLVLTREADDMLIEGAEELGYRLLHNSIPENIALAECIAQQQPVSLYDGKSAGAIAYRSLAKECRKVWGLTNAK
ncbi:MAG: ParA family protein [Symploca sp. SIO3C6]|nr:ParA family protein [Symploca sp. SIO3C6]